MLMGLKGLEIISIHAPSRERPAEILAEQAEFTISIHAPSRERPNAADYDVDDISISIHAPLRERLLLIWRV